MIEIPNTWEGKEQPADDDKAGNPCYDVPDYNLIQQGLNALLEEIKRYSADLIRKLNLPRAGYEKEIKDVDNMIKCGKEWLSNISENDDITIRGVSYYSLRYLKAGLLFQAVQQINKVQDLINEGAGIPQKTIEIHEREIQKLLDLSNAGSITLNPPTYSLKCLLIRNI